MKPLRQDFVRRCLGARCASRGEVASFVDLERLDENATRLLRDGLVQRAGSTPSPSVQFSLQFSSKCFYRSILVLQGRSAWLDHWKMDLACGSPVVFMADRSTPSADGFAFASPAYSFYSHLLRSGEHYIHIEADHLEVDGHVSVRVGTRTELTAAGLCQSVEVAQGWLRANPQEAACMGLRAQHVVRRLLRMDQVYKYMASVMRMIAARQRAAHMDYYVPSSPWFVALDVSGCLPTTPSEGGGSRPSPDASGGGDVSIDAVECVGAKVGKALTAGAGAVAAAARAPARPADWWQG